MKKRRIVTFCILGAVALGVLGWKGYGWWLKHKLERYKSELVARGEKLTLNELLEEQPRVEINGADLFRQAQTQLHRYGLVGTNPPVPMRMVAPGKAMVGWQQPWLVDSWNGRAITNTWEELAEELAQSQEGIKLLHQIVDHPVMDFRLDYSQGFNLMVPYLAPLKGASQTLSAAAQFELHRGNAGSATAHIRAMLAISQSWADEPLLISQLVRLAIAHISFAATWDLLQSPAVGDEELQLLQKDWERLDFLVPMRRSLEMERVMSGVNLRHFREKGGIFDVLGTGTAPGPSTTTAKVIAKAKQLVSPSEIRKNSSELLWQSALSYEDELLALQGMQVLIETCREIETNRSYALALSNAEARLEKILPLENEESESFWLGSGDYSLADIREMFSSAAATAKALKKVQQIEAFRALTVTAIALKRYQLANGKYPATLESLVPVYLAAVPADPVDGLPLRYRGESNGTFLLYSIGLDGVDDGGDASRSESHSSRSSSFVFGRDWVWPQPATVEEIKAWKTREAERRAVTDEPFTPSQPPP